MEEKIKPCPLCGKQGKVRYRLPYTWVECKSKKCCAKTGVYADWDEQCDPHARKQAIDAWNNLTKHDFM